MNRAGSSQTYVNSIRIPDRERKALLADLEGRVSRYAGAERRAAVRVACHDLHEVVTRVAHPGGSETMCVVQPRNLARRGAAIVVGSYLHPGTQCTLLFHSVRGEQVISRATIVHCRHVRGRLHEAGASFDRDFNLQNIGLVEPASPAAPVSGGEAPGTSASPSAPGDRSAAVPPAVHALAARLKHLLESHAPLADLGGVVDELLGLCAAPAPPPTAAREARVTATPAGHAAPPDHKERT